MSNYPSKMCHVSKNGRVHTPASKMHEDNYRNWKLRKIEEEKRRPRDYDEEDW